MDKTPRAGELYRHYKKGLYQVLTVARHSQTGEKLVIYQALQGGYLVYAEPLELFCSEVDLAKHPDVEQRFRFEKVDRERLMQQRSGKGNVAERQKAVDQAKRQQPAVDSESVALQKKAENRSVAAPATNTVRSEHRRSVNHTVRTIPTEIESGYDEIRKRQMEEREQRREQFKKPSSSDSATDELQANPNLLKFLDTDTYEEKYQVLMEIQDDITDRLIDDIAVVLDVVVPEGDLSDRFAQLKNIILTRQRYELKRLR